MHSIKENDSAEFPEYPTRAYLLYLILLMSQCFTVKQNRTITLLRSLSASQGHISAKFKG